MTMTSFLRRVPHPDNLNASTLYSVGSFLNLKLKIRRRRYHAQECACNRLTRRLVVTM
jgi:hypothetical protein